MPHGHDEDGVNVGQFAGGLVFDVWKDWSFGAASYYMAPNSTDWTENPALQIPLAEGMYYYNTVQKRFRVYDGNQWVNESDQSLDVGGLVTFGQMPLVGTPLDSNQIVPSGGTAGQHLTKADSFDYNTEWTDPASGTFDPNFDYTITGAWEYTKQILFLLGAKVANAVAFVGRNAANDGDISIGSVDSSDNVRLGDATADAISDALAKHTQQIGGVAVADFVPADAGGLKVASIDFILHKAGFRDPSDFSIVNDGDFKQSMEGQVADYDGAGGTLIVNQLEQYTTIMLDHGGTGVVALTEGAGVTLEWRNGTGAPALGNRNIASNSVTQLRWKTPTLVVIWSNGAS